MAVEDTLCIELIAATIFQYLNIQDLRRCRGVCRTWKSIATPFLQDKLHELYISLDLDTDIHPTNRNSTLLDMLRNSHLKFSSFKISSFSIDNFGSFRNYCPQVKSLKISINDQEVSEVSNIFKSPHYKEFSLVYLLQSFQNLETLEIFDLTILVKSNRIIAQSEPFKKLKHIKLHLDTDFRDEYFPLYSNFYRDLFQLCPNLQSFGTEMQVCTSRTNEHELVILESLAASPTHSSLTALQFGLVSDEMMHILVNKLQETKLKKFSAKRLDKLESDDFQAFLNEHSNSLEFLSFGLTRCVDLCVQFPSMPKLKYLHIVFVHEYTEGAPNLGEMNYGRLFPNLNTFRIQDLSGGFGRRSVKYNTKRKEAYSSKDMFPQYGTPCLMLRNLELPENLDGSDILERITRLLPNVRRVKIGPQLDAEILLKIWCSDWAESLEVLQVSFYVQVTSRMDSIFTGIPEAGFKVPQGTACRTSENLQMPERRSVKNSNESSSSIVNLKRLRYLVISSSPNGTLELESPINSVITDVTGDSVLSLMRELKGIRIENGLSQISDACLERICGALDLINVFPPSRRLRPPGLVHLVKYEWQNKGLLSNYLFDMEDFDGV